MIGNNQDTTPSLEKEEKKEKEEKDDNKINDSILTCDPDQVVTPELPQEPKKDCRAFFSDRLIGPPTWSTKPYVMDQYSDYVGAGMIINILLIKFINIIILIHKVHIQTIIKHFQQLLKVHLMQLLLIAIQELYYGKKKILKVKYY